MESKQIDRRFGLAAVEKDFITVDQLFEAIKIQIREELERGEHRLIGRILFDMGVMKLPQIDEVLETL
jgi:hypothetical protein